MKAYMCYTASGAEEGAVLVFANSISEAKRLTWHSIIGDLCDSYIDLRVKRLKNAWIYKYQMYECPHVIENVPCCIECGLWGSELNSDGICKICIEIAKSDKQCKICLEKCN